MSSPIALPAPHPRLRDPAWMPRVGWLLLALVVVWPLLVLCEFKPWILLSQDSLKPTLRFLADFFPPRLDAEFLTLVARETWRTVAIATAGLSLGLLLAIPLALLSVRVLSVSALTGRMATAPVALRWGVRAVLVVLRSVPELIWALVFVRVVGLAAEFVARSVLVRVLARRFDFRPNELQAINLGTADLFLLSPMPSDLGQNPDIGPFVR